MIINAQDYLAEIELLNSKIKNKLIELEQYRALAENLNSVIIGDKVQTSPSGNSLVKAIEKIYECEKELDDLIDQFVDEKNERIQIIEQIQSSNNLQYNILHKKYIQFMRFADIAVEEHCSEAWIYKQHTKALLKIQKVLENR